MTQNIELYRCKWCGTNPLLVKYHDEEWGVFVRDDRALFEFLILEGAQAGLTWQTVLNKRENYRKTFSGFDAKKIARYGAGDVKRLLANAGIIRNRLKIAATIQNAKKFLEIQKGGAHADRSKTRILFVFAGQGASTDPGQRSRRYHNRDQEPHPGGIGETGSGFE